MLFHTSTEMVVEVEVVAALEVEDLQQANEFTTLKMNNSLERDQDFLTLNINA